MIGDRMKILRGNRTQEDIAKMIGVSRARYSHYENGRSEPDLAMLMKIADFYSVSIDYLLGRTDEPYRIPNSFVTGPTPRPPYKHIGIEIDARIASRKLRSKLVMESLKMNNEEYLSLLAGEHAPTPEQAEILAKLLNCEPERFLPDNQNTFVEVAGQSIALTEEEKNIFFELKKHPVLFHDLASNPEMKIKELIKLYKMKKMFLDEDDDEDLGDGFGEIED